jgi:hypothetical protein
MELQKDMDELQVVVKFNAQTNGSSNESIWCDNIKLFVNYDVLRKNELREQIIYYLFRH